MGDLGPLSDWREVVKDIVRRELRIGICYIPTCWDRK
jgi:hypothetical protein